jgi:hypothetical protein
MPRRIVWTTWCRVRCAETSASNGKQYYAGIILKRVGDQWLVDRFFTMPKPEDVKPEDVKPEEVKPEAQASTAAQSGH